MRIYSQHDNSFSVGVREPNSCWQKKQSTKRGEERRPRYDRKNRFGNVLDSQGRLHLVYGGDPIKTVGVRDRGVRLAGIIAEQ